MIRLADWRPEFPPGRIEAVYMHWSGGDYSTVYPSYHYCVALVDGEVVVAETNDLRANMRDVTGAAEYAAHTYRRNSFAAGIAFMGMRDATPADFGPFPLTETLVDGLCRVAASLAAFYRIDVHAQRVLTHAEAAVVDGYFGAGDEERWDIARLAPESRPLHPNDAAATGDRLRERIKRYAR